MERRFGEKQVCSVGSFATWKAKGLLKDLARTVGVDFSEVNYKKVHKGTKVKGVHKEKFRPFVSITYINKSNKNQINTSMCSYYIPRHTNIV